MFLELKEHNMDCFLLLTAPRRKNSGAVFLYK